MTLEHLWPSLPLLNYQWNKVITTTMDHQPVRCSCLCWRWCDVRSFCECPPTQNGHQITITITLIQSLPEFPHPLVDVYVVKVKDQSMHEVKPKNKTLPYTPNVFCPLNETLRLPYHKQPSIPHDSLFSLLCLLLASKAMILLSNGWLKSHILVGRGESMEYVAQAPGLWERNM